MVVARPQDEEVGAELGHFQLSEIKAADVGVPRVKVTFTLHKENLLKVSATYQLFIPTLTLPLTLTLTLTLTR